MLLLLLMKKLSLPIQFWWTPEEKQPPSLKSFKLFTLNRFNEGLSHNSKKKNNKQTKKTPPQMLSFYGIPYLDPQLIIFIFTNGKLLFPVFYAGCRFLESRCESCIALSKRLQFCFPFLHIGGTKEGKIHIGTLEICQCKLNCDLSFFSKGAKKEQHPLPLPPWRLVDSSGYTK